MSRILAEIRATVSDGEREAFRARAVGRRERLGELGVHYWVFERSDAPGEMVQYVEARDPALLAEARTRIDLHAGEREFVLHQLEL